jgi:protein-tyrosine phosphatase
MKVTCPHENTLHTATCPRSIDEGDVLEMQIVCTECFKMHEQKARALALQPLKEENTCMDCGRSPARYSSNLMLSMCDDCRSQQSQSFLSLSFLKPKRKVHELPDNIYENRIFLGSQDAAANRDGLSELNITGVLVCGTGLQLYHQAENTIRYHLLPIDDSLDQNLAVYIPSSMEFIDEVLVSGGNVLIHCHAGISRSASMTIAWLMKTQDWDFDTAHSYVKSKRKVIHPNSNFVNVLKTHWEIECKNNKKSGALEE